MQASPYECYGFDLRKEWQLNPEDQLIPSGIVHWTHYTPNTNNNSNPLGVTVTLMEPESRLHEDKLTTYVKQVAGLYQFNILR